MRKWGRHSCLPLLAELRQWGGHSCLPLLADRNVRPTFPFAWSYLATSTAVAQSELAHLWLCCATLSSFCTCVSGPFTGAQPPTLRNCHCLRPPLASRFWAGAVSLARRRGNGLPCLLVQAKRPHARQMQSKSPPMQTIR